MINKITLDQVQQTPIWFKILNVEAHGVFSTDADEYGPHDTFLHGFEELIVDQKYHLKRVESHLHRILHL